MPELKSEINSNADEFKLNQQAMEEHISEFRQIESNVFLTEQRTSARYHKKHMLLPHERLSALLDVGAPFLALSTVAGYQLDDDTSGEAAGGGAIGGIGFVSGVCCMVIVDNYAVKGGTVTPSGLKKKLRLQAIAIAQKLPVVSLSQSGGANLTYATDVFIDGGKTFANQARMSAMGIPQITVVHGSATAGGAYQPGLSDHVIMVKEQATMYLAGPPLLKAATGEVATDEALGGASMHTAESGVADFIAQSDAHGIKMARDIVAQYQLHFSPVLTDLEVKEPKFLLNDLLGIVPKDAKTPYDSRDLIARIADASDYLEFKPEFDAATLCGFAQVHGHKCGMISNNGPITAKGAAKAAQFIQLCEQAGHPLIFLHNTTGFLVGTDAERNGIIKHGSKLIQAVANATVTKISINVGGSFGAGNYAMCGRGFDPDFIFSWPNSRTSVMGAEQAGRVMRMVSEARMRRQGEVDEEALQKLQASTAEMLERQTHAIASSARLEDDGIIDPRDTRKILGVVLGVCRAARTRTLNPSTFGVARF